ncbi:MAG: hotdog fold domain-containing protein [Gemmatimonadaceae bacterium]
MSHGLRLLKLWKRVAHLPGGTRLFSFMLGRQVPYTGSVRPHIVELRPGYARAEMADRRRVRNHLNSIHAVALVNLAEVVGGLAMLTGLPPDLRAIVTGLSIEYRKKARGRLTAEATVPPMTISENVERLVHSTIRDESGDVVAEMTVRWRVGPQRAAVSQPAVAST